MYLGVFVVCAAVLDDCAATLCGIKFKSLNGENPVINDNIITKHSKATNDFLGDVNLFNMAIHPSNLFYTPSIEVRG